jgi:hypothetical protein
MNPLGSILVSQSATKDIISHDIMQITAIHEAYCTEPNGVTE